MVRLITKVVNAFGWSIKQRGANGKWKPEHQKARLFFTGIKQILKKFRRHRNTTLRKSSVELADNLGITELDKE